MPSLSPADELFEIRVELARLQARETRLCAALQQTAQDHPLPSHRPGWPIRRDGAMH